MQNEAIDVVGIQVLERTSQRLRHLDCRPCGRIVRKTMVLPTLIGEFCLQEKVFSPHHLGTNSRSHPFSNSGFIVVSPLIGGVDASKSCSECKFS